MIFFSKEGPKNYGEIELREFYECLKHLDEAKGTVDSSPADGKIAYQEYMESDFHLIGLKAKSGKQYIYAQYVYTDDDASWKINPFESISFSSNDDYSELKKVIEYKLEHKRMILNSKRYPSPLLCFKH